MKRFRLKVTRRGNLRLKRGRKKIVILEIGDLEKLGHQCLDLAVTRRDREEAIEIFGSAAVGRF
jgi:hypothetical protein